MPRQAKLQPLDDGYRVSNELWSRIEPLIPKPTRIHPLGCHNPRLPDRTAMDAILLVLRTGMPWNALRVTGPCKPTVAHNRFSEWTEAGVFQKMWQLGLMEYDLKKHIDWEWLSMDGAMSKAPLGGEKGGTESDRQSQRRRQALGSV